MIFTCFTQKLKEKVGGLFGGGYVAPSQIIGGPAHLAPLFLRLCGEMFGIPTYMHKRNGDKEGLISPISLI